MANRENVEVEVKFFVPDLDEMRRRLLTVGAALARPKVFERNVRFDTATDDLMQRDQLLRLRQDTTATLTFKGAALNTDHSEARVREELEVYVDSFDMAAVILQRLGFVPQQVYEKYRETFHLNDVEVVLDEMPFGDFVELEGEEVALKATAAMLGLDWRKRILANYLALMAQLKAYHHLPFDDLTFANFQDVSVSIADVITS